jgi:hypothetical protein
MDNKDNSEERGDETAQQMEYFRTRKRSLLESELVMTFLELEELDVDFFRYGSELYPIYHFFFSQCAPSVVRPRRL